MGRGLFEILVSSQHKVSIFQEVTRQEPMALKKQVEFLTIVLAVNDGRKTMASVRGEPAEKKGKKK